MNNSNKVEIKHIYMNYHSLKGETEALKDINFSLYEGEFVSIVGPSGCGKSTLLNIICGLLKPSSGEIYLDGEKMEDMSTKIGYMFQRDQLFEWLNVLENVKLGLKIQHKMNADSLELIEELLKRYNLWNFRNHHPSELSGGMRQRVALIRTLALKPELLLLDEPFSALDYQTRLNVSDEISGIIKSQRKTVIMVTHDISEAISMSDRVIILSKRPAGIKNIIDVNFKAESNTPLKRRDDENFRCYFNKIWKELDLNDEGK
ncbi:ABC transporter ATP-binding protein [Clostridium omnivorum]|uniref:ABC transporter ATP-binding protein n=1 Tax=Clostridium omnivorum TaxID=1604902 RepID=A0ABQ5NC18_9CLOT|nr:ABC transporter ATP-binding protein [Clostridium sp. E14]GLC32575.1 ABC transporter ATP-binding protein [Clostridium sp. E14]